MVKFSWKLCLVFLALSSQYVLADEEAGGAAVADEPQAQEEELEDWQKEALSDDKADEPEKKEEEEAKSYEQQLYELKDWAILAYTEPNPKHFKIYLWTVMIIFFMYDVFLAIAKMINPAAFEEKKEGDAKKEEKKDEAKKDK